MLEEDTGLLLLEYLHGVALQRPYLAHAMKIPDSVQILAAEFKERSFAVMRFLEQTMVPQTVSALFAIKNEENVRAVNNPLSAAN